jgi:hypothetical protein
LTFFGDDHDLVAEKFMESARQTGNVTLQPPYGKQILCLISTIVKRYSTVVDIASTTFQVDFVETSGIQTPIGGKTAKDGIEKQNEDVQKAAVSLFTQTKTYLEKEAADLKEYYNTQIDAVKLYLRPLTTQKEEVLTAFDSTYSSIKANIDEVISDPATIAAQTTALMSLPLDTANSAQFLLAGYASLINSQFLAPFTNDNTGKNSAITSQFFGGSAVSALSSALAFSVYDNAPETISATEAYINAYNEYRENVDNIQEQFDIPTIDLSDKFIQTGVLDVPLNYLAQQTAGALIESVFEAKKEIKLYLDYETTAINIAIEYYPERFQLDEVETLDYVISTNKLTADELILIPRRREIVVYV